MNLDRKRTAVLGLHSLRDLIYEYRALGDLLAAEAKNNNIVQNTSRAFAVARACMMPVIYTRVRFRQDYADMAPDAALYQMTKETGALIDGRPGSQIIDELAPQPGEMVLSNGRVSGFVNTSLDYLLRNQGDRHAPSNRWRH